jgi:hypothetical protein
MHMLMCIVLSAVVIALCRAIRVVCLYDVSMIAIGLQSLQGESTRTQHYLPKLSRRRSTLLYCQHIMRRRRSRYDRYLRGV